MRAILLVLAFGLLWAQPSQAQGLVEIDPVCVNPNVCVGGNQDPYFRDGCVVTYGNCTDGWCTANLAGICSGFCTFNVASYCEGHCWVAIATVCDTYCSTVEVANTCLDQVTGPLGPQAGARSGVEVPCGARPTDYQTALYCGDSYECGVGSDPLCWTFRSACYWVKGELEAASRNWVTCETHPGAGGPPLSGAIAAGTVDPTCLVNYGDCTGACEVNLASIYNYYCDVNVAANCGQGGECGLNVASTCTSECAISVGSVCDDPCSAIVLGLCLGAMPGGDASRIGIKHCQGPVDAACAVDPPSCVRPEPRDLPA